MGQLSSPNDEFRFLASDAARVDRSGPLPMVRRVHAPLRDDRQVSGLAFRPGDPPRLVTLHGAGLNAHSFDPMLLALETPAHPVPTLSLDLPGHGRSDWRRDADYSPVPLAADVAEALDALAPEPVTLLGHSLGGLAAALVASARPALIRSLVLVDITPGVSPKRDAGSVSEFITGQRDFADVDEIIERAIRFGIGSDRASLARGIALNTRVRSDGRLEWAHHFAHLDAIPGAASTQAPSTKTGSATSAETAADPFPFAPLWDVLASLDIPIALVRASKGMVDDRLAGEWIERLGSASVTTIDGPHNLHEAAPKELASAVAAVLEGDRANPVRD